jgi:uncharacterized membrane protein YfcA
MIDPSTLSPWLWVAAPLVVMLAYTVFGLTGFGATAISVPLLAHWLPISYLVPLLVLLDTVAATTLGTRQREHTAWVEVRRLVPFMLVGFAIGVTVLIGVEDRKLRLALGIFSILLGAHGIASPTLRGAISTLWAVPAGIVGGAIATTFGAGGPIYATYVTGRTQDKSVIRSTVASLISISSFTRSIIFAVAGLLLHVPLLVGAALMMPFMFAGMHLGQRIHVGLTQQQMRRVVGTLLVLVGITLIARALG